MATLAVLVLTACLGGGGGGGGGDATPATGGATGGGGSSGGSSGGGAVPVPGVACAAPGGGQTALQAGAQGLARGQWCQIGMPGLTWSLIVAPSAPGEHVLEFASSGVYDPVRRKVRYFGGPHSGSMHCIEYDEAGNQWSRCSNPPGASGGHGYDHNAVDPQTGDHYVRLYLTNRFLRWDGSSWQSIANNSCDPGLSQEPAIGMTWDSTRGGLVTFSDAGGACFWNKATNSWSQVAADPGLTGSYHFVAEHNPRVGATWLTDGNDSIKHYRLTANGITELRQAPLGLSCCGGGGVLSSYDYGSEKIIVANPFGNQWYEFDLAADTWRPFNSSLPLDNELYDATNVEGIVVPISSYGVLLYVMGRGTSRDPHAFLYRH